jgi:ABC-2 type transport system ATP-binding protein
MAVLSLRNVSKRFGRIQVIRDATFEIEAGQTVGLVGPNGSGKSVLLKLLCGFALPTSGQIWIDPAYLDKNRSFPDRFGVAINGPAYLPHRTGRQNLTDLAAIRRRTTTNDIDEVLLQVGLDPSLNQKVRHYSLGMKQKLSLAQALIEQPEVLILDEPFNALDSESVTSVHSLLAAKKAAGTTIVFTSHHRPDIDQLSDEILEFQSGVVMTSSANG